jgi:outer membrane immunogenic protein
MNRIALMAGVGLAVLVAGTAHAQTSDYSYAKGGDGISDDARYTIPRETTSTTQTNANRTRTTTQTTTASAPSVVDTEPQAGGDEYDFSGPYVGGDIGYTFGNYDIDDPAGPDGEVDLDGWEGGLFVGYGFSHDISWLGSYLGVEAGYEWSGADDDFAGIGYEKDHAWNLSLRPGFTVYDDVLAYGIIGYSRAEFQGGADDEDLDGLLLGLGGEFDTNSLIKLRLEYTYANYEDANLSGADFDGHENQFKLGVVYRF